MKSKVSYDVRMSAPATVRLTGVLDPREGWKAERCTIAKSLDVLSARSSMLILREAFYGTTRFDDFAERVLRTSRDLAIVHRSAFHPSRGSSAPVSRTVAGADMRTS